MNTDIGIAIKAIFRLLGLEVRLTSASSRDDLRLAGFLKQFNVQLVLDVGANKGQFASELWSAGYNGEIVSFEALPTAHAVLAAKAANSNHAWTAARRAALSDQPGTAVFHMTKADSASSLLLPQDAMVAVSPQTRLIESISVETARLDDIVDEMNLNVEGSFLKIDVQGAEKLVLDGAPTTLSLAQGVIIELSLNSLYDGQSRAQDVLRQLSSYGLEIWDVCTGYRNPDTCRLNQIDVVCFKSHEP